MIASLSSSSALLFCLVAISGAAGLTYELLWVRALGLHFGTTTVAITTVVATFMAGLGFGYVWFGRRADRSARPLALYRRLELSIALSGLSVSLFLLHGGRWLDALAQLCAAAGPLSTACTVLVLALLMLVPTIAMGGTVPVLTSALARSEASLHSGRMLSLLYACNTLGAIAGALLPDFVSIPRFGMTFTACSAAAGNLVVALGIGRYERQVRPALEPPQRNAATSRIAALGLSAVSGFCALGLEVLWSRTLQHWAAALTTSFAVLLAVYLAALALGTLLSQRLVERVRAPLSAAGLLAGLTGLCAVLPLLAAPAWRDIERAWWPRPENVRRLGLAREAVDALLHAGFLELMPCLLMGATFPFLAAAWLRDAEPGSRSGELFVVNTFAGVLGSLVVGFWWLPLFGEQLSYSALGMTLTAAAAVCAWFGAREERAFTGTVAAALAACAVVALTVAMPASQLARAHFRSGGHLVAVEEGATTTAAAAARFIYGEQHYMELLTPGISMSSTRGDARRYMSTMAHVALLAAAHSERALLICYGVGNTASALLSHTELKRLDIVDLSPEVLALSPRFAAARGDDPLRDPRSHVFVDDGRHHLVTHTTRYDVITAEPPPPNYAGVSNLYSRELYQLARSRLAADGVMTQWLPVFQLSDDDVRAMIAAFVAVFPHTALLYGVEQQLVLIGSQRPLRLRPGADRALERALQRSYIGGVEDLLGSVLQTDSELRQQVEHVEPLSDERPTLQYPLHDVPEGTYYTARFVPDPTRALSLLPPSAADTPLRERTQRAAEATERARRAVALRDRSPRELRELQLGRMLAPALAARPSDQGLWYLLAADSDRAQLAETALTRPGAAELVARTIAEVEPQQRAWYMALQDAQWCLARRAFYAQDYARALQLLQRIYIEPDLRAAHALFVAGCLRALGQTAASSEAFRRAADSSSDATFKNAARALADRADVAFVRENGPWSE